jgi:hypothetical protein
VQLSEGINFAREDDDEVKIKAMEFFTPIGEQVQVYVPSCVRMNECARVIVGGHACVIVGGHASVCLFERESVSVGESMHMGAGCR